jgi:hypothetical protein
VPENNDLPDLVVAEAMLHDARSELALADGKASILLGALGVGVGAAIAAMFGGWTPTEDLSGGSEVAWWAGALVLIASAVYLAIVVWPRGSSRGEDHRPITYWGDVAAQPTVEDLRTAIIEDHLEITDRTLRQLHAVSGILDDKYRGFRIALALIGVAAALFALSAVLSA